MGKSRNSGRFYFLGLQNHCRKWLQAIKLKNACPLEEKEQSNKNQYGWFQLTICLRNLLCWNSSVQFSSVAQSCPTLCNPINHSTPGLPVHHQLPEFTQTHVHPAISPSVIPFSSRLQSFPASGIFPMSQLFASGGQSIGASVSASVLPMNRTDFL